MGVYIFMAVFMCVCVCLRVLAGRGNRRLGNLRHIDIALIIDFIPSLWRHYRGFEPGPAFMKCILEKLGVAINAGQCDSEVGVVLGPLGGDKPRVHYPLGLVEKKKKNTYSFICLTSKSESSFLAKRRLVFILWIVLILLSELRDYQCSTNGWKVWNKWGESLEVSPILILPTKM